MIYTTIKLGWRELNQESTYLYMYHYITSKSLEMLICWHKLQR